MIKVVELYALLDDCHTALSKCPSIEDPEYAKISKRILDMKYYLYTYTKNLEPCNNCNLDNSELWLNEYKICNVCGAVE